MRTRLFCCRSINQSVKQVIVHMNEYCGMPASAIALCIPSPRPHFEGQHVHVATVNRVLWNQSVRGHVEDTPRSNYKRKMMHEHWLIVKKILGERPYLLLDEVASEIELECGARYHVRTIGREIRRHKWSRKEMIRAARQRNNYRRMLYRQEIEDLMVTPEQLCFADEVGQDGRWSRRRSGWGPIGESVIITEYLNRGKHHSILALYGIEGFLAFDFKEGGYDADSFIAAVESTIVPHLNRYDVNDPLPNSIFVLDNCPSHWTQIVELRRLIEDVAGAKLVFLAPYSPIDNPIEQGFNCFKAAWRRHSSWLDSAPLETRIRWCLTNCYTEGAVGARNTYRQCGYL